jgi:hypothetical protein
MSSCSSQRNTPIRAEVAGVYSAARAIEGALTVGVTYAEFGTMLREFSKELTVARDRLKYDSGVDWTIKPILERYGELLVMYKDSATVWGFQIQDKKYASELPVIAAEYGVSSAVRKEKAGTYVKYTETVVDYDTIRQAIWERATKLQDEQVSAVYGSPQVAQKK